MTDWQERELLWVLRQSWERGRAQRRLVIWFCLPHIVHLRLMQFACLKSIRGFSDPSPLITLTMQGRGGLL